MRWYLHFSILIFCYCLNLYVFPIEIEYLSKAGICLPYNMQGLTEEQVTELKLVDEWSEKCIPSGGYIEKSDELGRRI